MDDAVVPHTTRRVQRRRLRIDLRFQRRLVGVELGFVDLDTSPGGGLSTLPTLPRIGPVGIFSMACRQILRDWRISSMRMQ